MPEQRAKKGEYTDCYLSPLCDPSWGAVGWCEGVVYLTSPGRPTDIGLQLGKTCCPCSR